MQNKLAILTVVLLLFSVQTFSQINTSSPYSRFGIGDTENLTLGKSLAMGGTSVAVRSPYEINIVNPASYSAIPIQSFLFQLGVRSRMVDYSTTNNSTTKYDNGLLSINAAFKLNKYWAASFGLNPLSSVGYKIRTTDSIKVDGSNYNIENNYVGEGGLNSIYIGNSLYYKGLSIGLNASYIFGPMDRRVESRYNDNGYNSFLLDLRHINAKGFKFRGGMQYSPDSLFGHKNRLTIGTYFENKTSISAVQTRFVTNAIVFNAVALTDTLINDTLFSGRLEMPMKIGFGLAYTNEKLLVAADFSMQQWEGLKFLGETSSAYTNSSRVSLGAEYTPNFLNKNIFKKTSYRIGGYYNTANLKINDTPITDMGVSLGFGIPLRMTRINVGITAGQRGTKSLVQENYYILNFNVNMADLWFVRRKFN